MEQQPISDSAPQTLEHIRDVQRLLSFCTLVLTDRGIDHDRSKLYGIEKELFDKHTPFPKHITYGSDEYKQQLLALKPALDNHYKENSHHPEHYTNGIAGMDLFDVLEMLIDWCAYSKRHEDGNVFNSLVINTKRFGIEPQLASILLNTLNSLRTANVI